jgi:hypothetical protein
MKTKTFWLIALGMLALDWGWGMAQVRGIVPLWSFLIVNFPFGIPYVWIESHWAGTLYSVGGRTVDELWSMALFCFMVFGQASLYFLLIRHWRAWRTESPRG